MIDIEIIEKDSCFHKSEKGYYISFKCEESEKPGSHNYLEHHEYQSISDAEIASGIIHNMIEKYKCVDVSKFDFLLRAVLNIIDSPNKW